MNSFVNVQIRILANQAQQQLKQLNMTIQQLSGGFGGASNAATKFGRSIDGIRLDALGSRVQWIGRQLEYNFTLPLIAAGAASFKFALDNEQALTRVTKVYGDAVHGAQFYGNEIKALERAFESLSSAFGVAQKDTIAIAADWAAAGASGLALAKSVKLTMETMILGEMNAADATKALIAIQAQYGFSVDKLAETISILNMVENQTGISLTGLVEGFARAAGVARSAGVDVRHLAAMLAALTPAAGSAAQAGNALKTIFSRLLSPTEETAEVLGLMGINVTDLSWQSANLVDRLNVLGVKFDALSDSQKGVVSSVVASRWQINKFEILMRELTSTTGYYQKALDSTADAQANFTQMQRELNTVLTSNPRRLQIIWTMLQNAMADIIQPAIPLLLHFANTLRTVVEWFSSLNPGVQKVILGLLAFLAIIGPLIRYLGATMILVAELGKAFLFLLGPIRMVAAALLFLTKVPIMGFFTLLSNTLKGIGPLLLVPFTAFGRMIGPTLAHSWRIITTTTIVGYKLWTVASWTFFQTLRHIWIWGLLAVRTLYIQWQAVMTTLWVGFHSRVLLASRAAWAFLIGGWRTTLMSIVALMTAFSRGVVLSLTTGLIPLLKRIGTTLIGALFGPWGIAIGLIVTLVITFWDQIVAVFNAGVRAVQAGFKALPANIQASLLNVLRSVSAVVMKIREWLSYLNPWARHSPSLVDNVTTGVAEIIRQFSLLSNVNRIFANAGVSIGDFSQALYDARQLADQLQWDKLRDDIAEFAPGLMGGFNQLMSVLTSLRGELSALESDYPIEAAKAMSDAIFENEMATKALQLQLMDLENAVGPMDELQSRLDQIAGAMELLQGERESLRNAGAGSEILSQYDDQISALNDQQSAIEAQLAPMRDLADQIKELQRQAERLSLMEALQFDPIRRQADELVDAISQIEDALNAMSQAASAAQGAAGGAMSPGAQNFIAAEGGDFPDVGGNDIIGREGGLEDQAALIDQFTKDLADASSNLFGAFDFLQPIKDAWNKAVGWLKENIGPAAKVVWETFTGALGGIANPFSGLDFSNVWDSIEEGLNFIGGLFHDVWEVIREPVGEVWQILKETWGKLTEELGPEFAKFKDLLEPIGQLFSELWVVIKPVAAIIGGVLLLAISVLANVLSNVLGPIIDGIIEILKAVIKTLRGLIEFIVGVFTGDWELAWTGIKDFFGGIWDLIFGIVRTALGLVWGVIRGVGEGIADWWGVLWTHIGDTIKGAWNNIVSTFWGAVNSVRGILDNAGTFIGNSINYWISMFQNLVGWLWSLPGSIGNIFWSAWQNISNGFRSALNGLIYLWNLLDFSINISIPSWVPIYGGRSWNIWDVIPDIGYLAKGGTIANEAMAVVGEGRKGYPEYVIPTDPSYRNRALMLFGELAQSLGIKDLLGKSMFFNNLKDGSGVAGQKVQFFASGGTIGTRRTAGRGGISLVAENHQRTINMYGNLEFPNVKSGADAEEFLRNLEALMDEA